MSGSFFDSNVLLYLASGDAAKATRAERLLGEGSFVSVQVLNEVVNVGRRKFRMSWAEIDLLLETLKSTLEIRPVTVEIHERGLQLAKRHNFSVYDAMIAAVALSVGCDTLWSEDMQSGMAVEGRLTIRNPFLP